MKSKFLRRVIGFLALVGFVFGMKTLITGKHVTEIAQEAALQKAEKTKEAQADKKEKEQKATLPDVSTSDWQLRLVNRDNPTEELSPELAVVGNVYVDARIADQAEQFLVAAQEIDAAEHFISGYRSVDYQTELYYYYLEQEMLANPEWTQEEAEKQVQTYSQPPGSSEHHTGLAIDMSTVDYLNQSDPSVVTKVVAMAPKYGFVLRYPKGKEAETGISYEDWHFRYVGVESAKYMKKHKLSLEAYLELLKEEGR